MGGEFDGFIHDVVKDLFGFFGTEWGVAVHEFVKKDSKAPYINCVIV